MSRIAFALTTVRRRLAGEPIVCPYCGSDRSAMLGRRRLVMQLRRCNACHLMYRYPQHLYDERQYYDQQYDEHTAAALPTPDELEALLGKNFASSPYDVSNKIRLVQQITPAGRLLDYGCSWGYTLHQWRRAGFDAVGVEIGQRRAEFARRELRANVLSSEQEIDGLVENSFDVIFANHVLEHLSSVRSVIGQFHRWLRPDGMAVIFVPNCGGRNARTHGANWGPMIGRHHALALDAEFFATNLGRHGFQIKLASDPYDVSSLLTSDAPHSLEGDELLVLARRN